MTEPVNYLNHVKNMRRISHAIQDLEIIDETKIPSQPSKKTIWQLQEQKRKRKRIMAGLDVEIQEINEILEKVNTPK